MTDCFTCPIAVFALFATIVGVAPNESGGSQRAVLGICVQLGCDNPQPLVDLIKQDRFLVQGLGYDQASVEKARELIRAEDRYGQVSAVRLRGKKLPYADHLINRFVVEDYKKAQVHGITLAELLRATCPDGVVVLSGVDKSAFAGELKSLGISNVDLNAKPVEIIKVRPKEIGDWSHARQRASGNPVSPDLLVGPPTSLRWITGPGWPRAAKSNSLFETLSAEGVNLYFTNGSSNESVIENRVSILARDAYNGLKLWERHWSATINYGTGNMPKLLHVMAVHDGRLFATLEGNVVALDLRTGRKLQTLEQGYPRRVTALDNTVVFSLTGSVSAYDAATLKPLWKHDDVPYDSVAGEGAIFYLDATGKGYQTFDLVSRDLRNGKERFRVNTTKIYNDENNGLLSQKPQFLQGGFHKRGISLQLYQDRHLCLGTTTANGIHVFSTTDGSHVWSQWEGLLDEPAPDRRGRLVKWTEGAGGTRAYFTQELLWTTVGNRKRREPLTRKGYDLKTGELKKELPAIATAGACKPDVMTENYHLHFRKKMAGSGLSVEDALTGELAAPVFQGRLACSVSCMPANGLIYMHPFSCTCVGMPIKGYHALESRELKQTPDPLDARIEKGPAVGTSGKVLPFEQDWPIYRGDAKRTASTGTEIPTDFEPLWIADFSHDASANLKEDWDTNLYVSGPLSAPVIAGDQVFVTLPDRHAVACLETCAGKEQWRFTAGGRVDSAPTIYKGRCYFGSSDGWVYCLNTDNGRLVWRLRLAPHERWIVSYGQLASAWPVHGSVLIDDGKLRALAGSHRSVDGGLVEYSIDPDSGKILSAESIKSSHPRLLAAKSDYPYAGTPTYGWLDHSWTRYSTAVGRGGGSYVVLNERRPQFSRGMTGKMVIGNANRGFVAFELGAAKSGKKSKPSFLKSTGKHKWETEIKFPIQVEAVIMTKNQIFTAGTTDRAKRHVSLGFMRVFNAHDGLQTKQLTLVAPPVYDGLAAVDRRIYLATQDGKLTCYGDNGSAPK